MPRLPNRILLGAPRPYHMGVPSGCCWSLMLIHGFTSPTFPQIDSLFERTNGLPLLIFFPYRWRESHCESTVQYLTQPCRAQTQTPGWPLGHLTHYSLGPVRLPGRNESTTQYIKALYETIQIYFFSTTLYQTCLISAWLRARWNNTSLSSGSKLCPLIKQTTGKIKKNIKSWILSWWNTKFQELMQKET